MSVSVGIATGAAVQSAAATAAAHAAQKTACMKFVQGFQNDTATQTEVREYAKCVDLLNPDPMSPAAVIALKAAIGIILLSMIVGGFKGHHDSWGDFGDRYIVMPIVWGTAALGIMFGLFLLAAAVMFLVTA